MWLSGDRPKSEYWIDDIPAIRILNADSIIDVTSFLNNGGNFKTASDLWSFVFLYERGGIVCDTDALAIKPFPTDEWILVSCDKSNPEERFSIGVMAAPKGQAVFKECIDNIRHDWYNVQLFSDTYSKLYGHTNSTHDDKLFYPYSWHEWDTALKDIPIPDVYSVHLYHTMFERNEMIKEVYNSETMLGRIISINGLSK